MIFTWLSSIFTVLSLVVFVGILFWAYSRNNKEQFEALGKLPIDNDNETTGN
ncbi:cbb3-type cytochrome c oxidase subunit 3 [Herminiimonas sp. CN]|uniref:cbb3-type cytochrome oxidase subunit 3 n=1 Tax=Herminiimonas sp. CN TaxID=1349818 RepID=UPI0009DCDC05|nr:cbb3-type cytochrome c oxidase subunit 3 [Herminiimonas sp. CN]